MIVEFCWLLTSHCGEVCKDGNPYYIESDLEFQSKFEF